MLKKLTLNLQLQMKFRARQILIMQTLISKEGRLNLQNDFNLSIQCFFHDRSHAWLALQSAWLFKSIGFVYLFTLFLFFLAHQTYCNLRQYFLTLTNYWCLAPVTSFSFSVSSSSSLLTFVMALSPDYVISHPKLQMRAPFAYDTEPTPYYQFEYCWKDNAYTSSILFQYWLQSLPGLVSGSNPWE